MGIHPSPSWNAIIDDNSPLFYLTSSVPENAFLVYCKKPVYPGKTSHIRYNVTPGGHKYYVPRCGGDIVKSELNQTFDSSEKGIHFYKEYGRLTGFNVRLTTETKDDTEKIVLRKYIVSSKAGFNDPARYSDESTSKTVKRRRTVSGRCGCKARCVLKYIGPNLYSVSVFVERLNHPLVSEEGLQFLKANREMTNSLRQHVVNTAKVNIGTSKSFSLMKEKVGGYANVGASFIEFRNFNRDLKCFVGERDAQMMIDKYNMIFAPFTGVDKHDRCVTFAGCLLSHEDIPSFTWAFEHFLKAISRNPVLMVTDQCPAMEVAIHNVFKATDVFPATKQRLCMWYIMEKFPVKLGNRLCKETYFMEKMKKFIWTSYIEPAEFEEGWLSV
ncbi:protein FAR1-RELATED SEQUENCE 5-like [Apium graveolens]|uniref:protein FAR1-RELATED SEQUENCE 5-like n=1 Tax=Apium graveolens TaxID=4045 RepID=UPI003D7AE0A0